MIHEPDRPGQHDWWTNWEEFTGPATEALAELRAEGLVRFTGLGGTTPYILAPICATGQFDVVVTAFNYSLLGGRSRSVNPEALKQNMGLGRPPFGIEYLTILATRASGASRPVAQRSVASTSAIWSHAS
jgi:aryl-alcohol dehydrogenase-like predicted oxidoreductase